MLGGTSANHKLNELLSVVKNIHDVEVCENFGKVSIAIADNQDVPVIPNREIGNDYMLGCADFICRGIALNNYILPMKDMFEPGNNTISHNLYDFTRFTLSLYMKASSRLQKKLQYYYLMELHLTVWTLRE